MRVARWLCLIALVAFGADFAAADYIDGEVRAHLRAGPGLEFRIMKTLPAGSVVHVLGREGEWIRVRQSDMEGWIPNGYVSSDEPASTVLPRVREKLVTAEGRVTELDQKLVAQTAALEELAVLRERNRVLESDASRMNANARWKSLTAGAGIVLVGILIGLIAPRGGGTRSRLKL
jgi:SH3 domain protein